MIRSQYSFRHEYQTWVLEYHLHDLTNWQQKCCFHQSKYLVFWTFYLHMFWSVIFFLFVGHILGQGHQVTVTKDTYVCCNTKGGNTVSETSTDKKASKTSCSYFYVNHSILTIFKTWFHKIDSTFHAISSKMCLSSSKLNRQCLY